MASEMNDGDCKHPPTRCLALLLVVGIGLALGSGSIHAADQSPQNVLAGVAPIAEQRSPATGVAKEEEQHGLPQSAVEIARPFGFPITNSIVVTWIVALALIVFAQAATRKMTEVPSGPQNLMEWLVESLYGFLESIIGPHLVRRTFWFFGTVFIFILAANWLSLLPGVGTIGWGSHTAAGFTVDRPLF